VTLSRRAVLQGGVAAGGLLIGCRLGYAAAAPGDPPASAFIRIAPDNGITLIVPRVEMGQGAYTSLPMLIAEELEVGLDQIALEAAPPDATLYTDSINLEQVTGTSATTMAYFDPLRRAGAVTRILLVKAAAQAWGVDPASCRAERAQIIHDPSGRQTSYGAVASRAATLKPPRTVPLKSPADWTLLGQPIKRLDQDDKVNGKAVFGIDIRLPGMLVAAVANAPAFGGRLRHVDDAPALAVKGVVKIVRLPDAVAVVAQHMAAARKGLAALAIDWDDGPGAADSSETIGQAMEAGLARPGIVAIRTGNAAKALKHADKVIEAVYELPLLAHAPMEPMNCTVHVRKDAAEIWTGTQSPVRARDAAAHAAGLPAHKVVLHNQLIGGGFGRRLYVDHVAQAVSIGRQVDAPVKVVWSREEDMRHDHYRPCYLDHLSGGLDRDGKPIAWTHRVCASAVSASWDPTSLKDGLDPDAVDPAAGPYSFPHVLVDYVRVEPGRVPTGWWRGVGPTHNSFMVESFMDELAAAAGQDPVAFRDKALSQSPRARAVLALAAEKSGWGSALPAGSGRGISLVASFGSFLAEVAEVTVAAGGKIKVDRVTVAVDCGRVVNPDTVRAQIEGGVVFGLTAALFGRITVAKGRIVEANFDDYRLLRIDEAPVVEVHIVASEEAPGGIGEPPTSALAPCVANAVFAATGKRLRKLPLAAALLKST
jgi:isoquinoline 1-oxidoreductase beta subunit